MDQEPRGLWFTPSAAETGKGDFEPPQQKAAREKESGNSQVSPQAASAHLRPDSVFNLHQTRSLSCLKPPAVFHAPQQTQTASVGCEALQAPQSRPCSRCTQLFSLPQACQGRPHLRGSARCLGPSCHIFAGRWPETDAAHRKGARTPLSRDLAFLTWRVRRWRPPPRFPRSPFRSEEEQGDQEGTLPASTNTSPAGIGDTVPSLREAGQWSI